MALSRNEAQSVSSDFFESPKFMQQVYEESPFFARLKRRNQVTWSGGNNIQWPLRYTTLGAAERVNPRQQIAYTQTETRTSAQLAWTYYVGKALISWDERVTNTGKAQIVNLVRDKAEEMREDLRNLFHTDLYATTQNSDAFQSLETIIDTGTTYADIAVADAAEWAAGFEDSTTTVVSLWGSTGSISRAINQCTFGPSKPDLIVTTRDLWSKFESLADPQRIYRDNDMADMGFDAVRFGPAAVVSDYAVAANRLYLIDTSKFEFRYHPDYNFKVSPWEDLIQAGFPSAMVKVTQWAGNMVCRMRKTSGKFTALDYTA